MLLAVFRMKWSGKLTTWVFPTRKALSKLMRASLGWQNVTATVGSRTRSSSRLSKCYLAFTASCIRISTRRMVEHITIQVGESRGERH
jgi:hypothetical protein